MASIPIVVELLQAAPDDRFESLLAVAYDRNGQPLAQTRLQPQREGDRLIGKGEVDLDPELVGDSIRIIVAPEESPSLDRGDNRPERLKPIGTPLDSDVVIPGVRPRLPSRADLLKRLGGYQDALRLTREQPLIRVVIPRPDWIAWPKLCLCWVRGRLVKQLTLPDGRTKNLPVCQARVTLCEIDRWPIFITRLPDRYLFRLRDDLIRLIRWPIPLPDPPPEPFPDPIFQLRSQTTPGVELTRINTPSSPLRAADASGPMVEPSEAGLVQTAQNISSELESPGLRLLTSLVSAPASLLRARLIAEADLFRPYLCHLSWIDRLFHTHRYCFATVMTDEDGRFSASYVHACGDMDKPDIYISAQQQFDTTWKTIYAPPIPCGTHWNYNCGDEITVFVSDPHAKVCVPEDPVDPPSGVSAWVMPYAVGAMPIAGLAGTSPPAGWPESWVRPDGLSTYATDYTDAPFGSVLGFRQQHSLSIPNDSAYFYRWSWRRSPSDSWTAMADAITRAYVRDIPGPSVQFPAVLLGPNANNLFRFRPALFDPSDWGIDKTSDPAGTLYYWPVDVGLGEIYAAKWLTPGTSDPLLAPTLAGTYQVLVQVFKKDGTLVAPGPGSFQFIVPEREDSDGTLQTRLAQPSEIVDNGFIFSLVIDNGRCSASIPPPTISAPGTPDDPCGFIRYGPGATVGLSFTPTQPAGRGRFSFTFVRGATHLGSVEASGDIQDLTASPYSRVGPTFAGTFPSGSLLGTCPNAAFAETLFVYAKTTNGVRRLNEYDSWTTRAFALAQL